MLEGGPPTPPLPEGTFINFPAVMALAPGVNGTLI